MRQYLELVQHVLDHGERKDDPQGVGNIAICGYQMRFSMKDGFPLITTRSLKHSWKALVYELLWFLSGSSDVADLHKHGVHLWDQWATPDICAQFGLPAGDLGPIYGPQWRRWQGRNGTVIDQIQNVIDEIRRFPDSRRLVVTAWNPEDVDKVFVAPCHFIFKFFVAGKKLSLHLMQRSADVIIGVPFNIASYSLLLHMVAKVTGLVPWEFVHTLSDTHIYIDQIPYAKEQLLREPRALPCLRLNPLRREIDDFCFEDFILEKYNPYPPIKNIPVAT